MFAAARPLSTVTAVLGELDATHVVTLDALQAAAGDLVMDQDAGYLVIEVPLPGRARSVAVRVRPCGEAWLLDDAGRVASQFGERAHHVLEALRVTGTELSLVNGAVTCGPWESDEVAAAVLRFGMDLGFLPTVAAIWVARPSEGSDLADRGTSATELWADETADWGTESLRESAREFQEDSLRRWAG